MAGIFDSAAGGRPGNSVGRLIPGRVRPWLLRAGARVLLPSARPSWAVQARGKVTIAGPLSSPTGIGEGARLAAEQFAALGYAVGTIDLTHALGWPGGVGFGEPGIAPGDVGGPLILHLNPPSFQLALLRHLRRQRARRRLIAYWAWELPEIPPAWREAFRLVHEVWVPSGFVAEALVRAGCPCPVRVVPHPVRLPPASLPAMRADPRFTGTNRICL